MTKLILIAVCSAVEAAVPGGVMVGPEPADAVDAFKRFMAEGVKRTDG